jgi:ribosomal protein S25
MIDIEIAEATAKEIAAMSYIELSVLCDTLFRNNTDIAEWIARDLEVRAMDKAICEAEIGEFEE